MNKKMKDNKTILERSKTYLVARDGEIEEDYGDVYLPDEGYQDFLNRNNCIIEMKNVDYYNRNWVNKEVERITNDAFKPYFTTLKKLDEKEIYKFMQKINVLTCLLYAYHGELPKWLKYDNGYDPEKLITAIENILGYDILKRGLVRIYNAILKSEGK